MSSRYDINARGERAELTIYGDIGGWDEDESLDAKSTVEKLANMSGPLDVRINSFGGSVADGIGMFNALRRYDGEVTTHIDGVAYSIASLIAMAGAKVKMASNALMMIHAPWGMTIGNAPDLRDQADILDKHAEAMMGSYLREGGPNAATVRDWLTDGEDHYFSAVDAAELGLVDEVTDPAELTQIAASLRDSKFNQPVANRRESQEAEMANENPEGNPVDSPETGDIIAKHSKTVLAAQAAGAKQEKRRRETIDGVFDPFYSGDELDPVTAIRAACLDDVDCTELDARRELQAYLAHKSSAPIVARESYGVPTEPTAPPRASKYIGGATAGQSSDEKVYSALSDAILNKVGVESEVDRNNPFADLTFSEMARNFAKSCGVSGVDQSSSADVMKAVLNPNTNIRLAIGAPDIRAQHATGDFSGILANVIDKAIRAAYDQTAETWRSVVRVGSVQDFRQANRPAMSAFDDLLMVPEGGEYKHGEQSDLTEYLQAQKWGRIFSITREALLADDLSAFSDQAMRLAMSAARVVGDQVWNVYLNNPTLNQDATPVFDALHSNIGTGGAPSVTTLSEARKLMRTQTDPSGKATLGLSASLLIVPPTWETEALTLISAQQLDYEIASTGSGLAQRSAANQFASLQPVIEHRLGGADGNGTTWFMQANPVNPVPFVEVAFVRGQETPTIESREGFNVDGLEYKVRQEFGVAPLAYQPVVMNAGA